MIKRSRLFAGVLGLVVLVPAIAFADGPDKVFVLKNGRKIRGELLSENRDGYSVRTEGGTVTLDKSIVARVEDPPPPPAHVLEPDAPAPDTKPDETPSRPSDTTPAPAATPAPRAPMPSMPSGGSDAGGESGPCVPTGLLASEQEIAQTRRLLLSVTPVNPADGSSVEAHKSSLADTAKKISLGAVVTILAEPLNVAHPDPSPEQQTGVELVLSISNDPNLRPLLARAIGSISLEKCSPPVLFQTILSVRDDEAGTLEKALLDKIHEAVLRKVAPDLFTRVLGQIGTARALPKLFDYLLAAKADSGRAIAETCRLIITAQRNADDALFDLSNRIDANRLPDYDHLASVLFLLGTSSGQQVFKVSAVLSALESAPPAKDRDSYTGCLARAYQALGSMGTLQAEQRLVQSFSIATTAELRIVIAEQLGRMKQDDGAAKEAMSFLVDQLDRPERTDREQSTVAQALSHLTGQSFGTNSDAWREYMQKSR